MPQIELTKVEPGMVLAADVIGPENKILVTAGSSLSVLHIELLKTRDITEVNVHSAATAEDHDTNTELLEMMAQRFRKNDDKHPFINELKKIWLHQVNNE